MAASSSDGYTWSQWRQENKQPLVVMMYVQICLMQRQRKQNKDGLSTKTRQCQAFERNILHQSKRWRIQAQNQSRSEKVGSSDARWFHRNRKPLKKRIQGSTKWYIAWLAWLASWRNSASSCLLCKKNRSITQVMQMNWNVMVSLQEIGRKCHSAGWHNEFEVGRPRETRGAHWSWLKARQDSCKFVGTAGRCWVQVARWTCHCSSRGTQVAHRVLPERCPGWNADTLETSELCGPIQGVQDCTCECPRSQAGTGKDSHVKIRDVGSTFFVSFHTVVSGWTWSRGTWRLDTLWSSRSAHSQRLCTRATSECLPVLSVTRLELLLVILTKPCMYCLALAVGSVVLKSIGVKASCWFASRVRVNSHHIWTPSICALRGLAQPHEHQSIAGSGNHSQLQEFRENLLDGSASEGRRRDLMQSSADTSSSSHEPPMEPRAYVEPGSGKHSVFTHIPKDPNCEIRLKTKMTRASCRRRAHAVMPRAEIFWDLVIADHKIPSEVSESRNNHRYSVLVQDSATQWPKSYPSKKQNLLRKPRKAARRKSEVPMPAAMPCKIPIKSSGEVHHNIEKRKTKYACIVDADESTRPRLEGAVHMSPRSCQWKRDELSEPPQSCSQGQSCASSNENSECKGSNVQNNGKTWENSRCDRWSKE